MFGYSLYLCLYFAQAVEALDSLFVFQSSMSLDCLMRGSIVGGRGSGPPEKSQSYQASFLCLANIGIPAKRHLNCVSLEVQCWHA